MDAQKIVAELDTEIARLTKARDALASINGFSGEVRRGPGRPKGSVTKEEGRRGGMTPEGRAAISAAMKARWAAKKSAKKSATK